MGFIVHIVLAVAALGAAQFGLGEERFPWVWALSLLLLPYGWSFLVQRAGRRGAFRARQVLARLGKYWGPLGFAALCLQTDWLSAVSAWTGADLAPEAWPEYGLLIAFTPFVLLQLASIHAETRRETPPGETRRNSIAFQVRMLLAVLAPIGLYLLIAIQVGAFPELRVQVEEVALVHAGYVVLLLGLLAFVIPAVITSAWDTVAMPPSTQREVLDAVAERAEFTPRALKVWRTGGLMSNAAILGLGERRVVLFSDALLASLPPRELAAVYGHEIGHYKRKHVTVFLAWTVAFFLLGDLAAQQAGAISPWAGTGVFAGVLVLWALGFGWLSRRCELEADLYSLELLQDPAAMTLALERVGGRSVGRGWRHFGTRERVAFLWRVWSDPAYAQSFRKRLKRLAVTGYVAVAIALGLQLWTMIDRLPEDRVRAALVLGRWDVALDRAASLPDIEEEELTLLRLGVEKQGDREKLPVEELEGALAASLEAKASLTTCAEYAELLVLAGRRELRPVVTAIEAAIEGEDPDWVALSPRWEGALRSRLR